MKRLFALLLAALSLTACGQLFPQITSQPTRETAAVPETTVITTTAAPETEAPTEAATTETTVAETTAPTETTEATEPAQTQGFDPTSMVAAMSLEEKVGQMFMVCFVGGDVPAQIQNYHLGGLVLFGKDFQDETPSSVIQTIAEYQAAAEIPLLIGVDEEGGTVTRVSYYSAFRDTKFPSPRDAWAQGGMQNVLALEHEKCALLQSLGINVNLAPVCDITSDPNSFMYDRSLGEDAATTAAFISNVVQTMAQYPIGSTLKHFPGYGNNTDTHYGIALDERPLEDLEAVDLVPFQAGIDAGCGAIMVSHTFVNCLDSTLPASLSPAIHDYLRTKMGFNGVILTDDLGMGAITDLYGAGEAAILAVLAGNDILCCSNYSTQYTAILDAVSTGRIPEDMIDQSVARILRWKYQLQLLENC